MSGIVGVVHMDGAPVAPSMLETLTASMAFRGPDALRAWTDGDVGLGHALLRTAWDTAGDVQPFTLDGRVVITADARIDDRDALRHRLRGAGRDVARDATDAELVLQAYLAWGERSVEYLLGDFAFGVWDAAKRQLFCARDHFGVKPFFYAHRRGQFVFSNTIQCLRRHPAVRPTLDDRFVADFLMFGGSADVTASAFADISRLPAAHALIVRDGAVWAHRYWSLPEPNDRVRHRRAEDHVEEFKGILAAAVSDRLRGSRCSVSMSGGMDSSSVAAIAARILRERGGPAEIRAFTLVYDELVPDDERQYAAAAAERIGMPIMFMAADHCAPFEGWDEPRMHTPEPMADPLAHRLDGFHRAMLECSRVMLSGHDGDSLLSELTSHHYRALFRRRRFGRLFAELVDDVRWHRRLPPIGARTSLRRFGARLQGRSTARPTPDFPSWIDVDLRRRHDLDARWQQAYRGRRESDSLRPRATLTLTSPDWASIFEDLDPGATQLPLEQRHPLADRRVVEHLCSVPAVPWCVDKKLLRLAMRDTLPPAVLDRPKTPMQGDALIEWCARRPASTHDGLDHQEPLLMRYVVASKMPRLSSGTPERDFWAAVRIGCFNRWLRQERSAAHAFASIPEGVMDGEQVRVG